MSERVYQDLLSRVGENNPRARLAPTQRLVELLGNPHTAAPVIHITGTNGKTSTSRIIESLLRAQGLRTGLLTSPHLEEFTERIRIDGEPITEEAVESQWQQITPYLDIVDQELETSGQGRLTFFEALTALGFSCFADAPVDVAIVEVGMGGEWDSTNVVEPSVSVFTPIGLDHVGVLGDNIAEIALTKSGIIKRDTIVVSSQQDPEVAQVIRRRSEEMGVPVHFDGESFALTGARLAVGGQLIDIRGRSGSFEEFFLPLFGKHQASNAVLALAAVESLLGDGTIALDRGIIATGLADAHSPGRLEVVGVSPTVVVDGAHNPQGAAALSATLSESFSFSEIALVVGILGEKDARGVLSELHSISNLAWITQSSSPRSLSAEQLNILAVSEGFRTECVPHSADALRAAREWAGQAEGRAVIVTGSLTLVGEARRLAREEGWKRP